MHRNSNTFRILLAVAVLLSLTVGIVAALPVTQNITYQGKLTDAAGNPLTGSYTVLFSLYEVSSAGSAIATDTHSVTATKGLFTTQITAAPALFDGRALWLGIKLGTDPEMTPRQELRPVPYALSLRPGSWITSNDVSSALNLQNKGGGRGLNVSTSGSNSPGVSVSTTGYGTRGISVTTQGNWSNGLYASTTAGNSKGVYASTTGSDSPGVEVITNGAGSPGVVAYTVGIASKGVVVTTTGTGSTGLYASTTAGDSKGVYAYTTGTSSEAIYANANGVSASGAIVYSNQSSAIYAETKRPNHDYGVQTPDLIMALGYKTPASDVAEYMPVTGSMTPGTVLIIGSEGKLQTTATAYDTRVAGIVSTEPGMSLGTREDGNPGDALIAVSGRVPCKVDASSAPVHAGDLLTTSNTPGYAMKAEPIEINGRTFYPSGIVLGKAMGTLESGTGTIEVLVTLQ